MEDLITKDIDDYKDTVSSLIADDALIHEKAYSKTLRV